MSMVAVLEDRPALGAPVVLGEAARDVLTAARAIARARKKQMDSYAIRNANLATALSPAAYAAQPCPTAPIWVIMQDSISPAQKK